MLLSCGQNGDNIIKTFLVCLKWNLLVIVVKVSSSAVLGFWLAFIVAYSLSNEARARLLRSVVKVGSGGGGGGQAAQTGGALRCRK